MPFQIFKILLAGLVLSPGVAAAEQIQTSWFATAPGIGWSYSGNWTNGIANNVGDKTYWATIDERSTSFFRDVIVSEPVVIDRLSLLSGRIQVSKNLTILGETRLAQTTANLATTSISVESNGQQVAVDLGSLILPVPGVLDRVSLSAYGSDSLIRWKNASIQEIGPSVDVSLAMEGAAIRDSLTGLSALRDLGSIKGTLNVRLGASVATDKALSIDKGGKVAMTSGNLKVGQDLLNSGRITFDTNSSTGVYSSKILVNGDVENFGSISMSVSGYSFEEVFQMGCDGNFLNQMNASVSLSAIGPSAIAEVSVANDLVNEGIFSLSGSGRSRLNVSGDILNPGSLSLACSTLDVGGIFENSGTLNIQYAMASKAILRGEILNTGKINSTDSQARLEGTLRNEGLIEVTIFGTGRSSQLELQNVAENKGTIQASSGGRVTILGTFAPYSNQHLTEGNLTLRGYFSEVPVIEWNGADIRAIDHGASITLEGQSGEIRNLADGSNALANLSQNDGTLELKSRTYAIAGQFSNTGTLKASAGSRLTLDTLSQNVNQHLTAGELSVDGTSSEPSVIEWKGADIRVIDHAAAITLSGPGGAIRNSMNGADAIENLRQNDGKLSMTQRALSVHSGFVNAGVLSLGDAQLHVLGDSSMSESSVLSINLAYGTASGTQFFVADGLLELGGVLSVLVDDWIGNGSTFSVVRAGELVGNFDNIVPGQRALTADGRFSFLPSLDVENQSIILSDFISVPEPGTASLIGLAAVGGLLLARSRKIGWL